MEPGDKRKFDELMAEQQRVGDFLRAFDPMLLPLEDLAKHGITLAAGALGFTATVVSVLAGHGHLGQRCGDLLLPGSWLVFLGAVVAGSLQLWRIADFRDSMRRFAYVLTGDQADEEYRRQVQRQTRRDRHILLRVQYACLVLGLLLLVAWGLAMRS